MKSELSQIGKRQSAGCQIAFSLALASQEKVDNIRRQSRAKAHRKLPALVAQLVEQVTLNHHVQGSSPCGGIVI